MLAQFPIGAGYKEKSTKFGLANGPLGAGVRLQSEKSERPWLKSNVEPREKSPNSDFGAGIRSFDSGRVFGSIKGDLLSWNG